MSPDTNRDVIKRSGISRPNDSKGSVNRTTELGKSKVNSDSDTIKENENILGKGKAFEEVVDPQTSPSRDEHSSTDLEEQWEGKQVNDTDELASGDENEEDCVGTDCNSDDEDDEDNDGSEWDSDSSNCGDSIEDLVTYGTYMRSVLR